MKVILLILLLTGSIFLQAQTKTKTEIEKRISKVYVPVKAMEYISNHFKSDKIKWYYEKSERGISFEAKFCEYKKDFSVEFSKDGTLEDIEVLIKFKKLAPKTRGIVNDILKSKFTNYKILKTQLQHTTYDKQKLEAFFKTKILSDFGLLELIVLGKTETSKSRYEILISSKGEVVSMLKLQEKNQLFLQF